MLRRQILLLTAVLASMIACPSRGDEPTMALWPDSPPGKIAAQGAEADTSGPDGRTVAGKPVIRLGNVSRPMLTVYAPPKDNNTGAAVIVCPGGGYNILAYDLEGTEVCQWLQSIGVTGVLLKYRVPKAGSLRTPIEPLQDIQRAISLVRHHAESWNIDSERLGVLGFSAGGNLAARASTLYAKRTYEKVDEADVQPLRPDFTVLIYPAYLFEPDSTELVNLPIDKKTPPMFLAVAYDDKWSEDSLRMGLALKKQGVASELHVYPTGGHGFGLRPASDSVTTWPDLCHQWMNKAGFLGK